MRKLPIILLLLLLLPFLIGCCTCTNNFQTRLLLNKQGPILIKEINAVIIKENGWSRDYGEIVKWYIIRNKHDGKLYNIGITKENNYAITCLLSPYIYPTL